MRKLSYLQCGISLRMVIHQIIRMLAEAMNSKKKRFHLMKVHQLPVDFGNEQVCNEFFMKYFLSGIISASFFNLCKFFLNSAKISSGEMHQRA